MLSCNIAVFLCSKNNLKIFLRIDFCIVKCITFVIQKTINMNTLQLIYHIASNPQITNVVLKDEDDRTPMQAIECLSAELCFDGESTKPWNVENWHVNTSLEKDTLLAWQ